jgi:hypothetical protein
MQQITRQIFVFVNDAYLTVSRRNGTVHRKKLRDFHTATSSERQEIKKILKNQPFSESGIAYAKTIVQWGFTNIADSFQCHWEVGTLHVNFL